MRMLIDAVAVVAFGPDALAHIPLPPRAEANTAAAREVSWPDGRKLASGPPATIGGQ